MTTDAQLDLVPDPGTGFTPADLRRAALTVCSYSDSAADARDLLEALGLLDELRTAERLAS